MCAGILATSLAIQPGVPLWLALDSIFAADLINQTAFVSALWQAYQQLSPILAGGPADLSQFLSGVDA